MNDSTQNILIAGEKGSIGKEIAQELVASKYNVIGLGKLNVIEPLEINNFFKNNDLEINHLVYSIASPIDFKDFKNESWEDFGKHFNTQIKGLFLLLQKLVNNHPLKSVLLIGSSCLFGNPPVRLASYTTAKYALLGLMNSLVADLARYEVRINMISPGLTGEGISKKYPSQFIDLVKSGTPLKRLVRPDDVAKLSKFLMSEEARYITGLNIPLDGGISLI